VELLFGLTARFPSKDIRLVIKKTNDGSCVLNSKTISGKTIEKEKLFFSNNFKITTTNTHNSPSLQKPGQPDHFLHICCTVFYSYNFVGLKTVVLDISTESSLCGDGVNSIISRYYGFAKKYVSYKYVWHTLCKKPANHCNQPEKSRKKFFAFSQNQPG